MLAILWFFQWRLDNCRRIINWKHLLHMLQLTLILLLVVYRWVHKYVDHLLLNQWDGFCVLLNLVEVIKL
jgi:hypothetical protein